MPALLRHSKKNIRCVRGATHQPILHPPALTTTSHHCRKETCWLLSNVAAGSPQQVARLVETASVLSMVITQMASGEWDVKKEAAWVVSNVATGGTAAHVGRLVECGAVQPLCDLLEVGDVHVVEIALDALEAVLRTGQATGADYVSVLHEAEGPERLERLQEHSNDRVYERSVRIIERYLGVEEEEDGPTGAGAADGQGHAHASTTYGFSTATATPFAAAGASAGFNFAGVPRQG